MEGIEGMEDTGAARPQPQPSLESAEFWASGADGVLRIAQCQQCGRWMQPKLVMCPNCRGRDIVMTPTRGRATVVGYSVNHQQWLPGFDPPYVVAIVALKEGDIDTAARLTTNIVNCDPADVRIGMQVRVVFEAGDEGVWIPLFEPDPDAPGDGALPEPEDYRRRLRPMVSPHKFEDRVAITGVGQSAVGRRLMVDPVSLTVDACLSAIDDAGLSLEDIDGLSTYPGTSTAGMSEGGIVPVEDVLQIRPTWVNGGGDIPGQNGSIIAAMLAVSSGLCRHVLCFRTVWQSSHSAMVRAGRWNDGTGPMTGSILEWRGPFGAISAANWIGCAANNYLDRYRASREVLGWIAINARRNASANPEAVYRDPITMDDYLSARMVSTPFGLLDCDVPSDGAVAVVVSAIETVPDLPGRPVFVEAVGTQIMERLSWDQGTLTHMPQSLGPSAHLWSRTSLRPEDVDVAELYDGFTFNALSFLEGLGFCGFGEATDFIDEGRGIAIDGRLPLNTHGGQLSAGRTHGYGLFREAVLQLRGTAPGYQVQDPKVAVVTAGGGVPSGAILLRTD